MHAPVPRRRGAARCAVAGVVAVSLLLAVGCRRQGLSRDQVRDRWVSTYVADLGLTESEAGCIVDRWFAEMSDAELRPLTEGDEPSDEQLQRFGELAVACGVGAPAPDSAVPDDVQPGTTSP